MAAGCSAANLCVHVLAEFVGAYNSIAILVRRAFQSLDDVIGEDSMTATPLRTFKRLFAIAAGRQRKERPVESGEARIDRRRIGGRHNRPAVARIGQQHFPLAFDLFCHRVAEIIHRISSARRCFSDRCRTAPDKPCHCSRNHGRRNRSAPDRRLWRHSAATPRPHVSSSPDLPYCRSDGERFQPGNSLLPD